MAQPTSGFQPRNTPAERRAFFETDRRLRALDDDNAELAAANEPVVAAIAGEAGWANYGSGWGSARVVRQGKIVSLQGLIIRASGATFTDGLIGTIPVGFRPSSQAMFLTLNQNSQIGRLDVIPDGRIYIQAGPPQSVPVGHWFNIGGGTWTTV